MQGKQRNEKSWKKHSIKKENISIQTILLFLSPLKTIQAVNKCCNLEGFEKSVDIHIIEILSGTLKYTDDGQEENYLIFSNKKLFEERCAYLYDAEER